MPLSIPPAPGVVERTIDEALRSAAVPAPRGLRFDRGALRPTLPLPVHRLARLTAPAEPPTSRLTGWRCLLAQDGRSVGTAECRLTAEGWEFSHFGEGPYISSTERALRLAEERQEHYQPRLLSVPELYMLTLWLHPDPSADPAQGSPSGSDPLIPLAPAPPGIAAERLITVDALVTLVANRLAPLGLAS
ncbi:hypothetical protein SAMN06297387_11431 [Streptomyces zhaozhouensis]|uniref:Uncharacterized protein n=1 Tax=Streptomyces zhaozhouensis TaxID=1300267 RepID=A0A286DZG2_9ACTN|nr:hypothetical protein [Streptomyces zhaozhouensis]SOD64052.1 hypothetical protein SAMN06297387_11431 [Streptomyces zhaozhouensis]